MLSQGGRTLCGSQSSGSPQGRGPQRDSGSTTAGWALPTCRGAVQHPPAPTVVPPPPTRTHKQSLSGSSPGSTLDRAWHFQGRRDLKTALRCTRQCKDGLGKCYGRRRCGPGLSPAPTPAGSTFLHCTGKLSSVPESQKWVLTVHTAWVTALRHPAQDTLHRTARWGPVGGVRPPVARQCQHPGQTWRGRQPHRQGPEPAPNGNLCSLGSEQGPSSASRGMRHEAGAGRWEGLGCTFTGAA